MPDPRRGRNRQYAMQDIGLAALSVFFMQSPSFLAHRRTLAERQGRSNAHALFGLTGIPCDNHIRHLLDGDDALRVNWFEIEIARPNGAVTYRNAFVTDLTVNRDTIAELAACGRARWKIENETFNVLKHHGYHLEHNYRHGKNTLASVLLALNLLAFALHEATGNAWSATIKSFGQEMVDAGQKIETSFNRGRSIDDCRSGRAHRQRYRGRRGETAGQRGAVCAKLRGKRAENEWRAATN